MKGNGNEIKRYFGNHLKLLFCLTAFTVLFLLMSVPVFADERQRIESAPEVVYGKETTVEYDLEAGHLNLTYRTFIPPESYFEYYEIEMITNEPGDRFELYMDADHILGTPSPWSDCYEIDEFHKVYNLLGGHKYKIVLTPDNEMNAPRSFKLLIKKHEHKLTLTKKKKAEFEGGHEYASGEYDGYVKKICSVCDYEQTETEIPEVQYSAFFKKDVFTFSGKAIKPTVNLKDRTGEKIPRSSYTVQYKNCIYPGIGTASVILKGNYEGSGVFEYKILPKTRSITKLSRLKKGFRVSWNKHTKVTGYQIRYSTNKSFKKAKTVTVKGASKKTAAVKKLKANKRYYVQVRAYRNTSRGKVCSKWSKAKSVVTK